MKIAPFKSTSYEASMLRSLEQFAYARSIHLDRLQTRSGTRNLFYVVVDPNYASKQVLERERHAFLDQGKNSEPFDLVFVNDENELPMRAVEIVSTLDKEDVSVPSFQGPVLGVWGHAHSGKDTVYNFVAEMRGHVRRFAFMDVFKRFLMELYGFTEEQLWGELKEAPDLRYPRGACGCGGKSACVEPGCVNGTLYLTPRIALQTIGIEWGNNLYQYTVVDHAFRKVNELFSSYEVRKPEKAHTFIHSHIIKRTELVVITDVREPSDLVKLATAGAGIIKITRPGAGLRGKEKTHSTETQFDDGFANTFVGYEIVNDGDLDDLRAKVKDALKTFDLI